MKKFIIATILFISSFISSAATYYVSDCQSGAQVGCVMGNDSNSGTTSDTPWKTTSKVQTAFNTGKPGDKILFAQGGSWTNVGMSLFNTNGGNPAVMYANPIVLDSYTTKSGNLTPPILSSNSGVVLFDFTNGGDPDSNGGIIVRNLYLLGNGSAEVGVRLFNGVSNISLENLTIDGFNAGIACGGVQPPESDPHHITIKGSTLKNNMSMGIGMWGCPDVLVENNTLDNNGFARPIFDHPIYISGSDKGRVTSNVIIRNNVLTNNSITNGLCQATVIVSHDASSDWVIENNYIYQSPGTAHPTCWGISLSPANGGYLEGMDRLVIRNNTIVNVGNNGIELAACRDCVVENNVVVWENNAEAVGIRFHKAPTSPTYVGTNISIRNNSIYFHKTIDVSQGIVLNDEGSAHTIVSNLVYFGPGSIANTCIETNLAASRFMAIGNNSCYGGNRGVLGISDVLSNPLIPIPSLSNKFSMLPAKTSSVIDKGNLTFSSKKDLLGIPRIVPDIGAHEQISTAVPDTLAPSAPSNILVK